MMQSIPASLSTLYLASCDQVICVLPGPILGLLPAWDPLHEEKLPGRTQGFVYRWLFFLPLTAETLLLLVPNVCPALHLPLTPIFLGPLLAQCISLSYMQIPLKKNSSHRLVKLSLFWYCNYLAIKNYVYYLCMQMCVDICVKVAFEVK